MTATAVLDVLIGIGVLGTALVALFARERITAVAVFLALGVLLTVLWARLGAPDIALAEAAIASGVTGALLMAATTGGRVGDRSSPIRRVAAAAEIAFGLGVAASLGAAFIGATRAGNGSPAVGRALPLDETVVPHPVTAVLLEFRSYDTFLEVAVLFTAVVVALSLHPGGVLRVGPQEADQRPTFDGFVRFLIPVVVMVAAWFLFAGSSRPGGAFQAGAVVTGALLLLHLSGRTVLLGGRWTNLSLTAGLIGFLVAAVLTVVLGDGWFVLQSPWGSWVVLAIEAVLTATIGVGLALLYLAGRHPAYSYSSLDKSGQSR